MTVTATAQKNSFSPSAPIVGLQCEGNEIREICRSAVFQTSFSREPKAHLKSSSIYIFPGTIVYYALRRIFETLRHMPMDNTIGNTNFIMLCFLHIGTIDVLFLNQMQSLPSFSVGPLVGRNKCHTYATIVGHGCKLLPSLLLR